MMLERMVLDYLRIDLLENNGSITKANCEKYIKQLSEFGYSADGALAVIKTVQQHVIDEIEFKKVMEKFEYNDDEIEYYADMFYSWRHAYKAFVELYEKRYSRKIFDKCLKGFEQQKLELVENTPKDILGLFTLATEFLEKYLTTEELNILTKRVLNDVKWFVETEHYIFIEKGDELEWLL